MTTRSDQLSAHQEMFEEIRSVYPCDPATFVSTHNDPNPANNRSRLRFVLR